MIMIRKCIDEDIAELEVLFQLTRRATFSKRDPDEFQIGDYTKSTNEDEVWVAHDANQIVGFVSIYKPDNFLHNLFVHPNHQCRRIGSQLLKVAEANLAATVSAKIAMDNIKACAFYEKNGWRLVSIHKDADEPYLLYKKIL